MSGTQADSASIKPLLEALRVRQDWAPEQTRAFMTQLMSGELRTEDVVEALELLRAKGETASEITEAARAMRSAGVRVQPGLDGVLDTCGTGGDGSCTVNVSSIVSLIAAAAGVPVAKHGNRAVSGVCGSADFLSAIGVPLETAPGKLVEGLKKTNFAFFYAPQFHPSVRHAAAARKTITGRTLFNCLGPITNPAGATHQLIGVYESRLVTLVAEALGALGSKHAIVVHSEDGLDEVSPAAPTQVAEWENGVLRQYIFTPEEGGVTRAAEGTLRSDNAQSAVREGLAIIDGIEGPKTDLVVLNAAFALKAADRARTVKEGAELARLLLRNGSVRRKVAEITDFYQQN